MVSFTRALLILALWSGAACSVYDSSLAYSNDELSLDSGAAACEPQLEACNRVDDDCDGTVDEAEATALDCASRVLHSGSTCQSGFCVKIGDCDDGYFNCDGMPDNGCESACPCGTDCDEDAGVTPP